MRSFLCMRRRGRHEPYACLDRLKLALEDFDLGDLGFEGDCFTWRNHNHNEANYIQEHMDRAVANDAWWGMFPRMRVINGDPWHSDHCPVWRRKKCKDIVEQAWKEALEQGEGSMVVALKIVAGGLKNWSTNILGD